VRNGDGVYINSTNLEFGAWPLAQAGAAKVKFTLFFPNNTQYGSGKSTTYGDPQIASMWVIGTFQAALGQLAGATAAANAMSPSPHPSGKGTVWELTTSAALAPGFYDYQYVVEFNDGTRRTATDPCARWGGSEPDRSGFVVGASPIEAPVRAAQGGRLSYRDLVVYELNIDDYTAELPGLDPPIEKVRARIPDLVELGANAIEFLPWTAWADDNYSWGYTPGSFFSIEHRYTHNVLANEDTIQRSRLKRLISELHDAGVHVIMDGVFNHAGAGFAYPQFYRNSADCPYIGTFGLAFDGLPDLDYHNACTQDLIQDVCFYWMDEFGIDGIRYDAALYYYDNTTARGIPDLTSAVAAHALALDAVAGPRFAQILEFLDISAAAVTSSLAAGSYWRESLYQDCFNALWNYALPSRIMTSLDAKAYLASPDKVATTYLSNHDHSGVAWQAGAAHNQGSIEWYRMQPYAIALLMSPGTPLIPNGQEFAADHWIMEDDQGTSRRVVPRALHWGYPNDSIGSALRTIYRRLIALRKAHPCLRSDDIYPAGWPENQGTFNGGGYGVDSARQLLIFHRWGSAAGGGLDRFIVALNFSDRDQQVDIPFPTNGTWIDQLSTPASSPTVSGFWLRQWTIPRYWGFVFLNTA
jgi:pullulanase/glycogen debranching enzyme